MECPICLSHHCTSIDSKEEFEKDVRHLNCVRCGEYLLTHEAEVNSKRLHERWKVSSWIRHHSQSSLVTTANLDQSEDCAIPSLLHRGERMLRWIASKYPAGKSFRKFEWWTSESPADGANQTSSPLAAIGWCRNLEEEAFMLDEFLGNTMNWIVPDPNPLQSDFGYRRVSAQGFLRLEGQRNVASQVGFCAMWFGDEVRPLWTEVIEEAIREAGSEPLRIDGKEHNERIDDEIIAAIRGARFVVADITGNRGGVYYEAGFAHGLGLPVIFMCRQGDELHFDVRQYNCIFWSADDFDEARMRLTKRIVATLGQGPLRVH